MDVRGSTLAVNGVIADFGNETLQTAAGQPVTLRPQAFAVLRYLAGQAGQLVTKDELLSALWPGLVVTDDSLVQCIHEIRRALQDEDRVVLKTLPKRGYRLVLPAETTAASASAREPTAVVDDSGGMSERGLNASDVGPSRRARQGRPRGAAVRQYVVRSRTHVLFRRPHAGRHNGLVPVAIDNRRFARIEECIAAGRPSCGGSRTRR